MIALLATSAAAMQCALPPPLLAPESGPVPASAVIRVFGAEPPSVRAFGGFLDQVEIRQEAPEVWRVAVDARGTFEVRAGETVGVFDGGAAMVDPPGLAAILRVDPFAGTVSVWSAATAPAYRAVRVFPGGQRETTATFPRDPAPGAPTAKWRVGYGCGRVAGEWVGGDRVELVALRADGSEVPAGALVLPDHPIPLPGADVLTQALLDAMGAKRQEIPSGPRDLW